MLNPTTMPLVPNFSGSFSFFFLIFDNIQRHLGLFFSNLLLFFFSLRFDSDEDTFDLFPLDDKELLIILISTGGHGGCCDLRNNFEPLLGLRLGFHLLNQLRDLLAGTGRSNSLLSLSLLTTSIQQLVNLVGHIVESRF